ncbi:VirB4 family type IV secretion/conjugal transfer ATPase (plasmid) [Agrobacterium tumefaciens]|uniref:conjugal transfer protein TrbE n=1 Tax=Rhizobium/Agrobacterium group TaxID=227290 RepID=UPI001572C7F5|nr:MULTISPECIES: conjugal transfer protein TrbE [Rhizobium/Agrobacterium group]NTA46159.1 VirB4 family type IV secretion/conjugal transfer ATPase [Agrobacterium tumefaciens]NTI46024.1 VirB4 family type IV secretion/conjugal transfer ATPase [Rhizobium rhizogenes]UXR95496.1 VirB4 family type IV secretion/conjugal transfer ATPase [Agrobacterium tumefaciens]UXS74424.1 VirB4 family type IV secretion/conjugal transfer ATPase [Agrobacterium tumefaciens]UXS82089.1 VirB4 family type IV secretion/conjug
MVALKLFRHSGPSFADLVPYAGLVDSGIILLKDGSLMAGWYFAGPDSESSTDAERNEVSRQINLILSRLGSGWMIQVEALRVPTIDYPAGDICHFPDPVTRAIDTERRSHFERESGHFESRHALILTWRPPEPRRSGLTRYVYSDTASRSATYADTALDTFRTSIREVEQYLANVLSIRRMVTRETEERGGFRVARYDELFQFIRFCITGENHPVRLPDIPMYLDWLVTAELQHGLTPTVENRFLGVVAIDGLPAESWPGILNSLDLMPLTYRWSSRFVFLDEQEARQKLERTRKKWQQKVRPFFDQLFQTQSRSLDQDAMMMVAETEDAIAEASSQLVAYGYYTPVIVLFDEQQERLQEKCEAIRRLIQAEGFGARIETLNATDAFLGSLPGVSYANIREPLVNTRNLADLIPLNSVWSGSPVAPCPFYPPGSPPLMQVASGSTPFRLNLHVDDVGHTLVFGPTGSGKSTLLSLIAAQFRRYADAQIFAFDKGRSMLPLTLAIGGDHYEIGGDAAEGGEGDSPRLAFCPLAELASDGDRAWAAEWIETLVALQGVTVTPDYRNAISRQLALMAESRGRSLSDFVSGVQMREIKDALHHYTVDGPMGQLLDAEQDGLALGAFQCFEVEELMNLGERNLVPVLLYMFRRVEKRLTGAPSLIILDEAWLMLGHPTFRNKIREWLKVLRKANCAVVLATQSISDAERSGIIDVLKESCPTKICLPNGAAREPGTREFYERIGFNERQIEIVATALPKREYYVASPEGRRLFDMSLGPVALSFVGASGKEDLKRIRALHFEHGADWPKHWLQQRGIAHAETLFQAA